MPSLPLQALPLSSCCRQTIRSWAPPPGRSTIWRSLSAKTTRRCQWPPASTATSRTRPQSRWTAPSMASAAACIHSKPCTLLVPPSAISSAASLARAAHLGHNQQRAWVQFTVGTSALECRAADTDRYPCRSATVCTGESTDDVDLVAWVSVGLQHLPRTEDVPVVRKNKYAHH